MAERGNPHADAVLSTPLNVRPPERRNAADSPTVLLESAGGTTGVGRAGGRGQGAGGRVRRTQGQCTENDPQLDGGHRVPKRLPGRQTCRSEVLKIPLQVAILSTR